MRVELNKWINLDHNEIYYITDYDYISINRELNETVLRVFIDNKHSTFIIKKQNRCIVNEARLIEEWKLNNKVKLFKAKEEVCNPS